MGGTAILGTDYEKSEFSDGILMSDGYDNKTVILKFKILNDDIFYGDETITMTLSPAPSSTVIPKGLPATATITIKDDETTPLTKIITPSAISGVASGTAKDSAALGLPDLLQLETADGNFKADVTWDVDSSSYDPSSKLSQSFVVDGNVTLPYFVTNPNNLDLNTEIEVHVNEKIPGKFAVSAVPSTGGSTTGSGIYSEGASVTVKAIPDSGYKFVNWMENGIVASTDASYTFTMGSENRTLTAYFDVITPKYTVVFMIDDGSNQPMVSVKEVLKGENVGILPAVPVRDGYDYSEGKPEIVTNSIYDSSTGMITFTTDHFSMYAVGHNKVIFADVTEAAWYGRAINYISARNITSGTDYENFSPDSKLTRAQFLVMVMRAYGILPDENSNYNFCDAGNTYYTGYVAAARRLGITNGAGNNMFEPDKEITRQEMAVLLYNSLKAIDKMPQETDNELSSFNDSSLVADWAKDAMTLFVGTGTINGSNNMLNPTATASRAEMAQMLYNLLTN